MASNWRLVSKVFSLCALVLSATACEPLRDQWSRIREQIRLGAGETEPSPSATPLAVSTQSESASVNARKSREHAELLAEMYTVIFLRDPRDRSVFGSYVDSLNQGATLEGIYNGFTHSSDFREVETSFGGLGKAMKSEGLVYFAEELARLVRVFGKPQTYTTFHVQPLPRLNPTEEQIERIYWNQPTLRIFPEYAQAAGALAQSREFFRKAGFFTLKRVLGDELQKILAMKSANRAELIDWYAQFAVDRCALGVNFGVAQRNQCDIEFHRNWAKFAADDRLLWEVLNRAHRLMNHFYIPAPADAKLTGDKK